MNLEKALQDFGGKLAEEADVRAVFGDPLELDGHTVVPVALVDIELGGEGSGRARLSATPVGYLAVEGESVVFKPIVLRPYEGARKKRAPKPRRKR